MVKRKFEDVTDNSETVVVKRGLHSTCKHEEVYNKIQKDVNEMSSLIVESSINIHFTLMKRWQAGDFSPVKFLNYYYPLMLKKKSQYILDPDYEKLRGTLPLYDSAYRSNIFVDSANQYEVIFHNNIWMHGYNRLRRYFKFENDKKKVYNTLAFVFNTQGANEPDEALLSRMRIDLKWNGEKLDKLQNKKLFWSSMELFYNLQRYNERNGFKNFSLIPIFSHGLKHIRYDSFAFHGLLCSLGLYRGAWTTFDRDAEWRKYFKFPETDSKKFNYSLQTDGVAVSFSMKKSKTSAPITTTNKSKRKKYQKHETDCFGNLEKIRNTNYDHRLGLDPGLRLLYGGVRDGESIKLKNSTYQHMSGNYTRNQLLKKYTKNYTEITQESPLLENYESYTKYRLAIFSQKQEIFGKRIVARLKLKKFICVEKTVHEIAKNLIPDTKDKTLVCIGSTEIAGNSPIRGYIRTPHRKLVNALRLRKADILLVNEFRTTKLCGNCKEENITSKSPHRYQFCPNCRTCWNRDVNAGVNILYLGECIIYEIEPHVNFKKNLF